MGLMFILSNTALRDKTDKDLIFTYKVAGFAEGTWDFENVFPVLYKSLPDTLIMRPIMDLALNEPQALIIKNSCEAVLNNFLKSNQEYSESENVDEFFKKSIRLNLKNAQHKVIDTFFRIYQIADECIKEGKPMFFSVIENY